MKTQDKLLQIPKTLSLQQCLIVCRHYESLKIHIQQIWPGSEKYIKFPKKHHPKGEKTKWNQSQNKLKSRGNRQRVQRNQNQSQTQRTNKLPRKCYGCGCDFQRLTKDWAKDCPAWGSPCRKHSKPNHWENVCSKLPPRRWSNQGRGRETDPWWVRSEILQHH